MTTYLFRRIGSKQYADIRIAGIDCVVYAMSVATDDDNINEIILFKDGEKFGRWYRGAFGVFVDERERC